MSMDKVVSKSIPRISVVFPVFDEAGNLETLYKQVREACKQSNVDYEMIFVDDGSTDSSLNTVKELRLQDKKVKYISLSRNFGHQSALFAGMSHCTGDAVITMDADLQQPPSLIPKMIELWQNGTEVVSTKKEKTDIDFMKFTAMKIFYCFFSKISNLKLDFGQSDFRLLDKKVLKVILEIPEYHKFLRGQVDWVGFRQQCLTYSVEKRFTGKPKYSYKKLSTLALDGIFAFSRYPLHLITLIGIIVLGASFVYILCVIIIWSLYKLNLVTSIILLPGWASLAVGIFFLGSLQLVAIGIVGEYVGRVYDQTKGRPVFIIREISDK